MQGYFRLYVAVPDQASDHAVLVRIPHASRFDGTAASHGNSGADLKRGTRGDLGIG
jgi:hypothetical protein